MNWEKWNQAEALLKKYNIKPLIGVIPDCKDESLAIDSPKEDFWNWLKQKQDEGYAIAMHGFNHTFTSKCRGIVTKRYVSEFAGHTLDEQIQKLKKGKKILNDHGIFTTIFFAPAHSYDENTLKALEITGFKYMSDGKGNRPYVWHTVKCLPDRDAGCPNVRKDGIYTAVFHAHEWGLPHKEKSYMKFANLIQTHYKDIVSFDEFSNIPCGSLFIQRLVERIYVFYERNIEDLLRKIIKIIR